MTQTSVERPKVVSREEWLAVRKELLAKEKQLTRQSDALAAERRELPWVKVEKDYVFDTPSGKKKLADLFEGRSQLIVYHFMFAPEWEEGCPSCSILGDHIDGSVVHLANRDVTLIAVSRAPLAEIEAFKKRMGWRFKWASSFGNEFNRDYHVSLRRKKWKRRRCITTTVRRISRVKKGRGSACFIRTRMAKCFTRIHRMGAGRNR